MLSALISFLGGSAFRMIWGEVSNFLTKKQDHAQEIERIRLQGQLDAEAHARNMDSIKLQHEMGVDVIRVQAESDVSRLDAQGYYDSVREAMKPTGILVVDTWNGVIRPMCATIAISLWVFALYNKGFNMEDWDKEMVSAVLGFFFADRTLGKRGK